MSNMMRIDESLAVMAEAAQKSAAAQERRAAAEERRVALEERNAASLERYAAAAERAALIHEANLGDSRAVRKEVNEFFAKLATELHAAIPLVLAKMAGVDVAAAAEQAEEEEAEEEEEEGQQPVPVAAEAPAKPEPAAKAEPAPAPVEVKQEDEEEKPAAVTDETASEDKAEQAVAPEESAPAAAPWVDLPDLDVSAYLKAMQELNRKYSLSEDLRKHIQHGIREELGIKALVQCEPKMRRRVVGLYEAALKRLEKEGLTAEAPLR